MEMEGKNIKNSGNRTLRLTFYKLMKMFKN